MRSWTLVYLVLASLHLACASSQPPPAATLDIFVEPAPASEPQDVQQQRAKLARMIGNDSLRMKAVSEVFHILDAEGFSATGDKDRALAAWLSAVKGSSGRFAKLTLERYLKLYREILGETYTAEVLARLVLSETNQGAASEYLASKGLTSLEALSSALPNLLPSPSSLDSEPPQSLPSWVSDGKGISPDDPFLQKSAAAYCRDSKSDKALWLLWLKALTKPQFALWEAKVAECRGQAESAINLYVAAITKLRKANEAGMRLHAAEQLVQLQRAGGNRADAAAAYVVLMEAVANLPPNYLPPTSESALEFRQRLINHTLWAARQQTVIADYPSAKRYLQQSFQLISQTYLQFPELNLSERQRLASFKADTYHTLAFRVAVEEGDLSAAQTHNRLAQEIGDLDREWRERLAWFQGFYLYLDKQPELAVAKWEELLATDLSPELRPQLHFWLARLLSKSKPESAALHLEALSKNYPLSFYAIVAPRLAGLALPTLHERLGTPSSLLTSLRQKRLPVPELRASASMARLTIRAEVLASADLGYWAKAAVSELYSAVKSSTSLRESPNVYLALARLYFRIGDFNQAISLGTQLAEAQPEFWSRNPEQVLLHFPKPFSTVFERTALDLGIEREWLYSIARQESGFRADIASPVGAQGLMQLMVRTAKRLATTAAIDTGNLKSRLSEPELNIRLGGLYLKELASLYRNQESAVFGAYNAGEYMIDNWLERRAHPDLLTWIELVPFSETKGYIRNVWRNVEVYEYLNAEAQSGAKLSSQDSKIFWLGIL